MLNSNKINIIDLYPEGDRTIVFLHGWPLSHRMFEYQFNFFPKYGIRCIGIDLPGFGDSDSPWMGYDYNSMCEAVHSVVNKLELKSFNLLGYSMGGGIAARYAAKYSDRVEHLMLLAAACPSFVQREDFSYGLGAKEMDALLTNLAADKPRMMTDFAKSVFDDSISEEVFSWFCSTSVSTALWAARRGLEALRAEDLRGDCGAIKVPTAIFHGAKDKICPYTLAQQSHKLIKGSVIVPFERSGHGIFYQEKDKLNQEILNFISDGRAIVCLEEAIEAGAILQNSMGQFVRKDGAHISPRLGSPMQSGDNTFRQPMRWEDTPLHSHLASRPPDKPNFNSLHNSSMEKIPPHIAILNRHNHNNHGTNNLVLDAEIMAMEGGRVTEPDTIKVLPDCSLDQTYRFVNTPLPYGYSGLEPHIDQTTMYLHHDKHLQKYIDELNKTLAPYPQYHNWRLERLLQMSDTLPSAIKTQVINNAGGVYNHFFYFDSLTSDAYKKEIPTEVERIIKQNFLDFVNFKKEFKEAALSVFGSGYAWLVLNQRGRAEIVTTVNQNTPLSSRQYPLLCIDLWEHAYYLKHYNLRADYIDDWFNVVCWETVAGRLNGLNR